MGWWSTDIMGGDTPLDYEDKFFGICNVNKFSDDGDVKSLAKEKMAENMEAILEFLEEDKWGNSNIGYQVLAVLMLNAGASIDPHLKGDMVRSCLGDDWASSNSERAKVCQGLVKALTAYDGSTPIILKSKGLFEVMNNKLNNN